MADNKEILKLKRTYLENYFIDKTKIEEEIVKAIQNISQKEAENLNGLKEKIQVIALYNLQNEKKKLNENLQKQIKLLVVQAEKESQIIYEKVQLMNQIILGLRIPTKFELKNIDNFLTEHEKEQKDEAIENKNPIDLYWYKAINNCALIKNEMYENDEKALQSLKCIRYKRQETEEELKFELLFDFENNDYFSNNTLKKTFIMLDDDTPIRSIGTQIDWKQINLTKRPITKVIEIFLNLIAKQKQKGKTTGEVKEKVEEIEDESFFKFFNSVEIDPNPAILHKIPEQKIQQLQEQMEVDYDIARILIDEVIPYSLEYFLGQQVFDNQSQNENEDDIEEDESQPDATKLSKIKQKKKN